MDQSLKLGEHLVTAQVDEAGRILGGATANGRFVLDKAFVPHAVTLRYRCEKSKWVWREYALPQLSVFVVAERTARGRYKVNMFRYECDPINSHFPPPDKSAPLLTFKWRDRPRLEIGYVIMQLAAMMRRNPVMAASPTLALQEISTNKWLKRAQQEQHP